MSQSGGSGVERIQQRVTDAVNQFLEDVDSNFVRQLQKRMYECSAACCGDRRAQNRAEVNDCLERCQAPVKQIHTTVQTELNDLQGQLSRCAMVCFDKQKQQFGSDPSKYSSDERAAFERALDSCFERCANDHIGLLAGIRDRVSKEARRLK